MKTSTLILSLLLSPVVSQAAGFGALNGPVTEFSGRTFKFDKVDLKSDDEDMIALVKKTAPSVVMIHWEKAAPAPAPKAAPDPKAPAPDEMEEMLKRFFTPKGGAPTPPKGPMGGTGSGVIVSRGGRTLIVTNAHVVKEMGTGGEVDLMFDDGSKGKGKILGFNERFDLAIVEPAGLCKSCGVMALTDSSKIQRGQIAVAIGSPFGMDRTITRGIVSFVGRDIQAKAEGSLVDDFIQTDAAINPGNSGGALVDREGRLIGINTAIFSRSGASAGIGFATPSNHVTAVLDRFARTGIVSPSRIGLSLMQANNIITVKDEPDAAAPAARAGFKKDDIVLEIDGVAVGSSDGFVRAIASRVPADGPASVKVRRGDKDVIVKVDVELTHP